MYHDVSVVIPNYNRVKPLFYALKSILLQSESVREVIIVDDCSEIEKFELVKDQVEKINSTSKVDFYLFRQEVNKGANFCRNYGINVAKGKYIAFLDSDDIWMRDKIKTQMEHIYRAKFGDTRPILSCTGRLRVDGGYKVIAQQFSGKSFSKEKLLESNFLGTLSSAVVDTWLARFVNGFDESLPACQDWDFFIRLSNYIKYVGVSEPLCVYVDHDEERITSGNKKRIYGHLRIRSKYLKSNLEAHQYSEFYRNLAEDYSELGDENKAIKYYVAHKIADSKNIFESVFKYIYYKREAKLQWKMIKKNRYTKYRKKPVKADLKRFNSYIEKVCA